MNHIPKETNYIVKDFWGYYYGAIFCMDSQIILRTKNIKEAIYTPKSKLKDFLELLNKSEYKKEIFEYLRTKK